MDMTEVTRPSRAVLDRWIEQQIEQLLESGVSPTDAEDVMAEFLTLCPSTEDPRIWVPDPGLLAEFAEPSDADVKDAREAWRNDPDVPNEYKLLLDAQELPEED